MNPWIKRALVTLALGVGAAGLARAYRPLPLPVEDAAIDRGPIRVEVTADGRTRVKHRFVISSPITGAVARPELSPGDVIKRGDALLDVEPIEPPLLDARSRAEADAQVRLAQAARAQAEARIELTRTSSDYARVELERAKQLVASGSLAHAELDAAELKEKSSAQENESAKLGAEVARFQLQAAEAAASRAGGKGSGGTVLRSPIDGRVLRVIQQDAGVINAGAPLLELGDPRDLEVVVDLLSTDAVKVKAGALVAVERWGGEGELGARVRTIEPAGYTKVSALGIEEQRVNVIADFTDALERRAALGDSYRIEARVVLAEIPDAVRVPLGALFRDGDEWAVYTLAGGHAHLTRITVGRRNQVHAEVLTGLAEGARVVVHPGDALRDGAAVAPRVVAAARAAGE